MNRAVRVLLVDDESDYSETMGFYLMAHGYDVAQAASGTEALEAVAQSPPDVVFLDVLMPGMDGIETLRRLKSARPDVPVIMVTAFATDEKIRQATALGAAGVFPKAADFSEAARLIHETLKGMKDGSEFGVGSSESGAGA